MALEREMETFRRELPGLLANPLNHGKYALVFGDRVEGVYPSLDEALKQGYERFGLEPFMVKQILADEQPLYFSRDVVPCRSCSFGLDDGIAAGRSLSADQRRKRELLTPRRLTKRSPLKEYFTVVAVVFRSDSR